MAAGEGQLGEENRGFLPAKMEGSSNKAMDFI
jgi:hypothetical protein